MQPHDLRLLQIRVLLGLWCKCHQRRESLWGVQRLWSQDDGRKCEARRPPQAQPLQHSGLVHRQGHPLHHILPSDCGLLVPVLSRAVELAELAGKACLRASRWCRVRILLWTASGRRRRANAFAPHSNVHRLLDTEDPLLLALLLLGQGLAGLLCEVSPRIRGSRRRTPEDPRGTIGRGKQGACPKADRRAS